jgi:hypothetical protein
MDVYTAIARIIAESLAVGNGILSHLINMPANASGPLDPNITLTGSGLEFISDIAVAATKASSIMSTTFAALF